MPASPKLVISISSHLYWKCHVPERVIRPKPSWIKCQKIISVSSNHFQINLRDIGWDIEILVIFAEDIFVSSTLLILIILEIWPHISYSYWILIATLPSNGTEVIHRYSYDLNFNYISIWPSDLTSLVGYASTYAPNFQHFDRKSENAPHALPRFCQI